ncbi:hypothetical protein ACFSYH_03175 [Populibacterium corticicola]|uniref:Uncharacterized protein n=1 Tax=Populibacterium corticicola TaxID=1812826 RepID=A0ABW5XB89_9MICO
MSRFTDWTTARQRHSVPRISSEGIRHIHARWILGVQLVVATACVLVATFDIYPPAWWVVLIATVMCAVTVARGYSPLMVYLALTATALTAFAFDQDGVSPLTMALTVCVVLLLRTNSLLLYSKPATRFELAIIARELLWVAMISAGLVLIAMIANLVEGAAEAASLAVATLATIVLVMAVALGARSPGQPERKKLNTVETLGPVDE